MKKKLKDTGGLTLVELLCAVVILVLLCLMMNTGLTMAVKSYRDITAVSETQLLLSSLADALTDKLRYCVVTDNGGTCELSVGAVDIDTDGMVTVGGDRLLPGGAYGDANGGAYIGRYRVSKADVTPTVSGTAVTFDIELKVEETSGSISAETALTVRCLNPVK